MTAPSSGKIFSQAEKIDLAGNAFNGAVLMAVFTVALSIYPWSNYMTKRTDADGALDDDGGLSIGSDADDERRSVGSNDLEDLLLYQGM